MRPEVRGTRAVGDHIVRIQDIEDGLQRDRGLPKRLVGVGEALHRTEEPADVSQECQQRSDRHLAPGYQVATDRQGDESRGRGGQGAKGAGQVVGANATAYHLVSLLHPRMKRRFSSSSMAKPFTVIIPASTSLNRP